VDEFGNILLDVCGTEVNPLGYNHNAFKSVVLSGASFDSQLMNNCAADSYASAEHAALVKSAFDPVAPPSLTGITLVNS
jgi:hypothetical protein